MEFKKKLKTRLYIAISYIVLGLVLITADVLNHFENTFIFSFGVTMLVMGIARLIRHRKTTKDEKSMRKQELLEKDERSLMMNERARSWAFSFSVMVAGFAVIVLSFLGYQELALPFAWYVCGQIVLYFVFLYIIAKKY